MLQSVRDTQGGMEDSPHIARYTCMLAVHMYSRWLPHGPGAAKLGVVVRCGGGGAARASAAPSSTKRNAAGGFAATAGDFMTALAVEAALQRN